MERQRTRLRRVDLSEREEATFAKKLRELAGRVHLAVVAATAGLEVCEGQRGQLHVKSMQLVVIRGGSPDCVSNATSQTRSMMSCREGVELGVARHLEHLIGHLPRVRGRRVARRWGPAVVCSSQAFCHKSLADALKHNTRALKSASFALNVFIVL